MPVKMRAINDHSRKRLTYFLIFCLFSFGAFPLGRAEDTLL